MRSATSTTAPRSSDAIATAWPIGPAPSTSTCSPAATRPRATVRTAIEVGSMNAVSRASRPSTAKVWAAGTTRRSCSAPSLWMPIRLMRSQAFSRPIAQAWHSPHADSGHTATRRPGARPGGQSSPAASTMAENSCPCTRGNAPAEVPVEVVEVRSAEADRLGSHEQLAGPRPGRLGDLGHAHGVRPAS